MLQVREPTSVSTAMPARPGRPSSLEAVSAHLMVSPPKLSLGQWDMCRLSRGPAPYHLDCILGWDPSIIGSEQGLLAAPGLTGSRDSSDG